MGGFVAQVPFPKKVAWRFNTQAIENLQTLKYVELESPTIGLCYTYSRKAHKTVRWSEIHVDPKMKDNCLLKTLMYHELGHCILYKDHRDNPTSVIMSPTIGNCQYYEDNWDWMLDDLFSNVNDIDQSP